MMLQQVHAIRTICFGFINYVYIIVDYETRKAAIVDPAWEFNKIVNKLESMEVELTTILLTHSHIDHVNLVNQLLSYTGSQVYMSRKEIETYKFRCKNLNKVDDSDIIELGQTSIFCLLTPGHTEGSMCYLTSDSMFTGDVIFIEGCGICNDKLSASKMYESIQRIKKEINEEILIYPGHCYSNAYGYPLKKVMKKNIYFQLEDKERFIEFRMRKGQKNYFNFI